MPSVLAVWEGVHGIAALRLDGPLAHRGMAHNELREEALGVLCRALDID